MSLAAATKGGAGAAARRTGLLIATLFALGCGAEPTRKPVATEGALPNGVVARVGASELAGDTVGRIARSQGLELPSARELAVHDALLEAEARARGLDHAPDVELGIEAVLARRTLSRLMASAEAAGPVTDEELEVTSEKHWLDLDRPDAFRTVHALVRLDEKADADKRRAATEVADAMRRAIAPVASMLEGASPPARQNPLEFSPEDELVATVKLAVGTVSHGGFEIVVEALPPVTADGRVAQPAGGLFDAAFARGASALSRRGELGGPVSSSVGVHVILLVEKIPGHVVPAEERRTRVRDEVISARAQTAERKLLEGLRPAVSIDRSVDGLLAKIAVEP